MNHQKLSKLKRKELELMSASDYAAVVVQNSPRRRAQAARRATALNRTEKTTQTLSRICLKVRVRAQRENPHRHSVAKVPLQVSVRVPIRV